MGAGGELVLKQNRTQGSARVQNRRPKSKQRAVQIKVPPQQIPSSRESKLARRHEEEAWS